MYISVCTVLYCMCCIDTITLIINNIIHKIICRLHQTAARSRSAHAQCDKKRGRWRREVQILCNTCAILCNTVQLLCNFCATERSLLARADSFFCNGATLLARFVATAPRNASALVARSTQLARLVGALKGSNRGRSGFGLAMCTTRLTLPYFGFLSSSYLKHMFKICHHSPKISFFNKSQASEVLVSYPTR